MWNQLGPVGTRYRALQKLNVALMMVTGLVLSALSFAAPPEVVSYQELLSIPGGGIVADGDYELRFGIFSAPTGGTASFEITSTQTIANGVLNVQLSGAGLAAALAGGTAYLEIEILDGPGISAPLLIPPRRPIAAAPYAIWAVSAPTAVGPVGPPGPTGALGVQGDKGDKGPGGFDGPQGPQGDEGLKGDDGLEGSEGAPGFQQSVVCTDGWPLGTGPCEPRTCGCNNGLALRRWTNGMTPCTITIPNTSVSCQATYGYDNNLQYCAGSCCRCGVE